MGVSGLPQNINPWTLYLTDSGGQPEFQELLPALVVGPCVFFVVLPLNKELNEKYKVEYMRPDNQKYYRNIFPVALFKKTLCDLLQALPLPSIQIKMEKK